MAKRGRTRGAAAFLITFFVFLALFGGVGIWGLTEYWQHTRPEPEPSPSTTPTTGTSVTSKAHHLLLITEQQGEAQGFVVLSAEASQLRIRVIPLPRETAVTSNMTDTRLCDLYKNGDLAALTERVSALLDLPIEHYAVLSYTNLQKLISHLGDGVIYTLAEPISYQSQSGLTVNMRTGTHTLSAVQVTDLLSYQNWRAGDLGRASVQGEIAAAVLNQYFVASRFDEKDTDFGVFINLVRSNVLASDFAGAREDLLALAKKNEFNICRLQPIQGEFVGSGDTRRFEPADAPLG